MKFIKLVVIEKILFFLTYLTFNSLFRSRDSYFHFSRVILIINERYNLI